MVRFVGMVLMLGGWALAGLCLHIVRVPDPDNAGQSKLVVVPKNRLDLNDTYVDARGWTMADATSHPILILRILESGKAQQMKFLGDPSSKKDIEAQLTDALSSVSSGATTQSATSVRTTIRAAGLSR